MKKMLACVVVVAALALCGCASTQGSTGTASSAVASAASTASTTSSTAAQFEIPHRYASASEGKDLLFSNEKYYAGFSQNDPGFRTDMYKLVHFTVHGTDYTLPSSVMEYHISNPDVEHHDSSAVFRINGKDVECFADFITTRHFEKEGDSFFGLHSTALVPVDGSDLYYTPDQAENFYEVFGRNTEYVIDPEECMADNFSYALTYGTEGKDGNGYESPEIIEGVIAYLSH